MKTKKMEALSAEELKSVNGGANYVDPNLYSKNPLDPQGPKEPDWKKFLETILIPPICY